MNRVKPLNVTRCNSVNVPRNAFLAYNPRSLLVLMVATVLLACAPSPDDLVLQRRDWVVMGTTFSVTVYRPVSETRLTSDDLQAAHDAVDKIDQLMSLYRADSELMALNARAGEGLSPVSTQTFDVLEAAEHYAQLSESAIDVTVQPLIELWGFFRVEMAAVPPQERIDAVLQRVGIDRMTLSAADRTVALESGTALDLGSIAKGYAVDQALDALRARGVPAALVDLGGNIGVLGQAPGGRPWVVGIRHPREGRLIGQVRFERGAVSTSGDYERYFVVDGKRYSHLLDPRTGWPVDGLHSVTVVAPNATAADALSTAAFVLGPARGIALLDKCEGVEGLLVEPRSNGANIDEPSGSLAVRMTVEPATGPASTKDVSFVLETKTDSIFHSTQILANGSPMADCAWPISPHY